jgi:hypothetical protein
MSRTEHMQPEAIMPPTLQVPCLRAALNAQEDQAMMEHAGDPAVEAKLKALIRYLVTSFPQTSILSRQVGETHQVFVIVPYEGGPEKTIQVDRAMLADRHTTVDEFCILLERLHLPTLLQSCDRYDLCHSEQSQPEPASTRLVGSGH